jgi:hypothetical protein
MNQRRVRVLPRSESRRGEYAAKPLLLGLVPQNPPKERKTE